ncbi:MAG: hypothetical protein J6V32_06370 [Elusimicrobiaceae bacterium]|nr:hypothetical protein [Elusimicrobiaceae bacterium]
MKKSMIMLFLLAVCVMSVEARNATIRQPNFAATHNVSAKADLTQNITRAIEKAAVQAALKKAATDDDDFEARNQAVLFGLRLQLEAHNNDQFTRHLANMLVVFSEIADGNKDEKTFFKNILLIENELQQIMKKNAGYGQYEILPILKEARFRYKEWLFWHSGIMTWEQARGAAHELY